jgi:phosphoglycerate dehydrogenase-like enzyme
MKKILTVCCFALLVGNAMAEGKKVVITSAGSYYSSLGPQVIAELREAAPQIKIVVPDQETMMEELADADGVIGTINPEMLRAAKKLQWVQVGVAGVERFLTPEMVNSSIILTNCKILQGPEIGDHAMALLLGLTRQINRAVESRAREEWLTREYQPIELQGRTAVVIGVGGIGMQIAVRAHAFGMQVIGVDVRDLPYLPFLQKSVYPDRLDSILPEADVVFVAAPHTPETDKMFGARQFELMKEGGYFISVSRGKLCDTEALVAALESGRLAGAGLDVTDPEPLPKGHRLWQFENVIITPHVAGRSDREHERYIALYKENLKRFAAGEPLLNVVDKQRGY